MTDFFAPRRYSPCTSSFPSPPRPWNGKMQHKMCLARPLNPVMVEPTQVLQNRSGLAPLAPKFMSQGAFSSRARRNPITVLQSDSLGPFLTGHCTQWLFSRHPLQDEVPYSVPISSQSSAESPTTFRRVACYRQRMRWPRWSGRRETL